jgi:hypothetical protein
MAPADKHWLITAKCSFMASTLQVVRYYLANLYTLEAAIPGSGANLDTAQASV